jgi:hypothetical protein
MFAHRAHSSSNHGFLRVMSKVEYSLYSSLKATEFHQPVEHMYEYSTQGSTIRDLIPMFWNSIVVVQYYYQFLDAVSEMLYRPSRQTIRN